jgi:hypothetical protein
MIRSFRHTQKRFSRFMWVRTERRRRWPAASIRLNDGLYVVAQVGPRYMHLVLFGRASGLSIRTGLVDIAE